MAELEKDHFITGYNQGKAQLVYRTLPADLLTPVAALLKLRNRSPYHMLLESVEGGAVRGRHSIIVLEPDLIWRCQGGKVELNEQADTAPEQFVPIAENAFASLKSLIKKSSLEIPPHLPPMASGLFGYMGYDMVRLMEDLPMPQGKKDVIGIPDSIFIRPKILVVFDAVKDEATVITPVFPDKRPAEERYVNALREVEEVIATLGMQKQLVAPVKILPDIQLRSHISEADYEKNVEKAKEYIRAGDIFQVVPSRRLSTPFTEDPLSFYRSLRHLNPSPYLFYLALKDFVITGSSPEILVRVKDGKVTIRPIAGTRKRGKDRKEDAYLAKDLLSDPKEISEHLMLLDLGRNDVGRVAKTGTVKVTEKMVIEYYSHVMHIVSNVEGELREDKDVIDALIAGFPAGTVSGAPKIRAMEIIDELETEKRTFYGGCVGYFSSGGEMDTCIALRTALIKDGVLYLQAGGGVVADSDPQAEFVETTNKAGALKKAAEQAGRFS